MKPWAKQLLRYAIASSVAATLVLVYYFSYRVYSIQDPAQLNRYLSNAFFLGGVFVFGSGVLVFVSNEGVFNFLNYAAQKLLSRFIHSMKVATMEYRDFCDFQNSKPDAPCLFLILVGLAFVGVGAIFAFLFIANPSYPDLSSSSAVISSLSV